jgi:hypothetical protein
MLQVPCVRVIVKERQQTEDLVSSGVAPWEIGKKSTLRLGRTMVEHQLRVPKSSYRLFTDEITGDGLSYSSHVVSGNQACRLILREGYYLTGSPTSILTKADIVRKVQSFYPEGWLHDDTEACFRILAEHDLGFKNRRRRGRLESRSRQTFETISHNA